MRPSVLESLHHPTPLQMTQISLRPELHAHLLVIRQRLHPALPQPLHDLKVRLFFNPLWLLHSSQCWHHIFSTQAGNLSLPVLPLTWENQMSPVDSPWKPLPLFPTPVILSWFSSSLLSSRPPPRPGLWPLPTPAQLWSQHCSPGITIRCITAGCPQGDVPSHLLQAPGTSFLLFLPNHSSHSSLLWNTLALSPHEHSWVFTKTLSRHAFPRAFASGSCCSVPGKNHRLGDRTPEADPNPELRVATEKPLCRMGVKWDGGWKVE